MRAWWQFVRERFEPGSHLAMVGLFFLAHWAVVSIDNENIPKGVALLPYFLGVLAFFFKLRLYDEIKDYEVDLVHNPTRPLARGLLTHGDLYSGILVCIVIEVLTLGVRSEASALSISVAIFYSLLMYREFFIGKWIRPHLTTYAVLHTVVSVLLSCALLSALTGKPIWELPQSTQLFALSSWWIFNIFEFGRKTFAPSEERDTVESYSKIFAPRGAVLLVVVMAFATWLSLRSLAPTHASVMDETLIGLLLLLAVSGRIFSRTNSVRWAKIYRTLSSVYIVLIYLALGVMKWSGILC